MEWSGKKEFGDTALTDWFVGEGEQPTGKTRAFGNLTFATVYDAGHTVPRDRPAESLEMVRRWLANEPL